jgi:hypothetical protein
LHGAYAQLTPQEGGLGFLNFDPLSFKAKRFAQATWTKLYSAPFPSTFESPYGTVHAGTAAVLGSIGPHEAQLVSFEGSSATSQGNALPPVPFATGNTMRFRQSATSPFNQIAPASPGDTLTFRMLIYSPYGHTLDPVQARVTIKPHPAQQSVTVAAFVAGPNESAHDLGSTTVNAVDTPMIALSVVPGSTQLLGYPPNTCTHPRNLGPLPDGIAEGGVEIGPVGGFHPRDPCKGQEFMRWVQFDVHVTGMSR